jgi:ABC-type transporter Mla subunit MlaD
MGDQILHLLASIYFSAVVSLLILLSPFYFKRRHDVASMSGLTTTLGIYGTFLGIFFGLLGFDVGNITASVPQLLGGLKTAFLTSIAGMSAGLILKEFPWLYGITVTKEDEAKEQATVETMVQYLSGIEKNQRDLFQRESQQLIKIEKALCGEGETTLLTQIQKLRTSFADKQDELIKSFNEFARNVADNNSKALIDALTQVMKDFNTKINEQFGDNFKRLNEAVGKILEWQQEYGKQVDAMVRQIQTTTAAVEQSSKTLELIISEANSFAATAQGLHELLTSLEQIRSDIANHLKAFDQLASNARNTFPVIDEQLKKLTTDFTKAVERTLADSKSIVTLQLESTKQLSNQIQDAQRGLGNSLVELVKNLNSNIDKMMKDNADRITQQVKTLDEQLGEELNKSLRTLGSQLASLSNQFVKDYTPLTEQLRKVVQMAGNSRG